MDQPFKTRLPLPRRCWPPCRNRPPPSHQPGNADGLQSQRWNQSQWRSFLPLPRTVLPTQPPARTLTLSPRKPQGNQPLLSLPKSKTPSRTCLPWRRKHHQNFRNMPEVVPVEFPVPGGAKSHNSDP